MFHVESSKQMIGFYKECSCIFLCTQQIMFNVVYFEDLCMYADNVGKHSCMVISLINKS